MNILDIMKQQDKQKHFIAGLLIFAFFHFTFPIVSGVAPLIVGVLKEVVWDKILGKGTPDKMDAIVTGIPGLLAFVC